MSRFSNPWTRSLYTVYTVSLHNSFHIISLIAQLNLQNNLHNYYWSHCSKQMNNKYQQMSFDDINDQERWEKEKVCVSMHCKKNLFVLNIKVSAFTCSSFCFNYLWRSPWGLLLFSVFCLVHNLILAMSFFYLCIHLT